MLCAMCLVAGGCVKVLDEALDAWFMSRRERAGVIATSFATAYLLTFACAHLSPVCSAASFAAGLGMMALDTGIDHFVESGILREGHGKNLDNQLWDFLFGSLMAFFLLRHVLFTRDGEKVLQLVQLVLRPVVLAFVIIGAAACIAEVIVFDIEYSPAKAMSRVVASAACAYFMFAILSRCPQNTTSSTSSTSSPGSIAPLFAFALGYFLVWFIAKLLTVPCMRRSRIQKCDPCGSYSNMIQSKKT